MGVFALFECCTSAEWLGRTSADFGNLQPDVQWAYHMPASLAVSSVPLVLCPVQQGALKRSFCFALPLQRIEVEVLVDLVVRALSGTVPVEAVVCSVVVLLSTGYPQ